MEANDTLVTGRGALTISESSVSWPQQWTWPTYTYWIAPQPEQDYANEVVVERSEFDATLTFYRNRDGVRVHVSRVTVPLGLLDAIAAHSPHVGGVS
jgi:hypothetical protein